MKKFLWKLGGSNLSPGFARSWLWSKGWFSVFAQRLGDKCVLPEITRKPHLKVSKSGGYVGYSSQRWTWTLLLYWGDDE